MHEYVDTFAAWQGMDANNGDDENVDFILERAHTFRSTAR